MLTRLCVALVPIAWSWSAVAAPLTATEALAHVGENATVCGLVASTKFATETDSQPTFLDFDKAYPEEPFVAVIFGGDRPKFGKPEVALKGKRICVTGKIQLYRKKPEIILQALSQITEN